MDGNDILITFTPSIKTKRKMQHFEIIGYSKDYYLDGKYIGSINIDQPDREKRSYYSRQYEVLEQDTIINRKKYKKGTRVMTELQNICGKLLK